MSLLPQYYSRWPHNLHQMHQTRTYKEREKATDVTLYLRGEESAQDATEAKEGN